MLTGVDRQRRARHKADVCRAPRALGLVHAGVLGDRAFEHPVRQRRVAQRLAGIDVVLDPARHLLPTRFLPQLEHALLHAKAPAHRQVDLAG